MNKIDKILGLASFPIAVGATVCAVLALYETNINWYKVAFYSMLLISNAGYALAYLDNRD